MLPGIRFLFAAITLSVSILVFGLGAAALLRAAHEEFASNSSWRAAPEPPMFTQHTEPSRPPVLAMLRVEPQPPAPKAAEPAPMDIPASMPPAESAALSAPAEPEAVVATPPDTEKLAVQITPDASPLADAVS